VFQRLGICKRLRIPYRITVHHGTDGQLDNLAKWTPRHARMRAASLTALPVDARLALEMAVNEENERCALAGELALLELAWKEAEEVAQIADRLTIPSEVEERYEQLRRRQDGDDESSTAP